MFALLDEPEKAARWVVFALGGLVAVGVQGGTIYSASQYGGPRKKDAVLVEMSFFQPPPPPPTAPPTAPPPPPPTEAPKPPPKVEAKAPPKVDEPPRPEPPKQVPLQTGLTADSTVSDGAGPTMQVGNTQMGNPDAVAKPPVTMQATPPPPPPPPPPPVRAGPPVVVDARILFQPPTSDEDYSLDAKDAGVEGTVIVLVSVDEKGLVVDAKVAKPLGYGLDEKGLVLARKHRFSPKTIDGVPTRTTYRLSIKFTLED